MTIGGKRRILGLGIVGAALLSLSGAAQIVSPVARNQTRRQPSMEGPLSIRVDTEMVLVDVTVTEDDGSPVTGLDKSAFHLFENGEEQEIVSLSSEDVPVSIGLIFDLSGSMSDKLPESRQAVLQFLKTANPRDEFFLVTFNDRAALVNPFTLDLEELQKSVMTGEPKGRTALLDAIYLGMSQMRAARYNKRALLVISDGGDNHSRYRKAQVRNALKEADCALYSIGFFRFKDVLRSIEERNGPGLLAELSETTGGRMFPVSSLADLASIGARIGMDLRNRYVLGYEPANRRHDGAWRRIKIRVVPPLRSRRSARMPGADITAPATRMRNPHPSRQDSSRYLASHNEKYCCRLLS